MHTSPASLWESLPQPHDEAAWEGFVKLYTPLLCCWARRLGAQGEDVADLVQDVFTLLVQKLPQFSYDPDKSFRGWLWTLTLNKWREKRRQRQVSLGNGRSGTEPAAKDPIAEFDEAEFREFLVCRVLALVQAEFRAATWQAFWAVVVEDRPAAEVARELGLSENAIYLAKRRVLRRLRRELCGLLP